MTSSLYNGNLSEEETYAARIQYSMAAKDFEERLAKHLLTKRYKELNNQFGIMAESIWTKVAKYDNSTQWNQTPKRDNTSLWRTLGTADATVPGAVGVNRESLEEVVKSGNIRERAALLFHGSIPQKDPDDPGFYIIPFQELAGTDIPQPEALKNERSDGRIAVKPPLPKGFLASDVRPALSEAEKRMTAHGETLPWIPGSGRMHYQMRSDFQKKSELTGGLVATGSSGTSYWLMRQAHHMKENWGADLDLGKVRLALVATMVQNQHHTYHETMRGVDLALKEIDPDRSKYPNMIYDNSFERHRYLWPLGQEELRKDVAYNNMFPDEHAMQRVPHQAVPLSTADAARLSPISPAAAKTAEAATDATSPTTGLPHSPNKPKPRSL